MRTRLKIARTGEGANGLDFAICEGREYLVSGEVLRITTPYAPFRATRSNPPGEKTYTYFVCWVSSGSGLGLGLVRRQSNKSEEKFLVVLLRPDKGGGKRPNAAISMYIRIRGEKIEMK